MNDKSWNAHRTHGNIQGEEKKKINIFIEQII